MLFGVGLYFSNLIERKHYERELDDAIYVHEMLNFRWRSLGNLSTIYLCIFHDEYKRLDALRPIPEREAYLEVWSHQANEWLNSERTILNELTQRHSTYDSDWKNELDEAREDFLEKLRR